MTEVFDSTIHDEVRTAKIQSESERIERERAETKAVQAAHDERRERDRRLVEDADVAHLGELLGGIQTHDQLLAYVRATRDEKPAPAYSPPPLTARMRDELEAEQRAGREAVEKAQAALDLQRKIAAAALERERAAAGEPGGPVDPEAA